VDNPEHQIEAKPSPSTDGASQPVAPSPKRTHSSPGAVGVVVVVACLLLPVVLSVLASLTEEAAAQNALQAIKSAPTAVESAPTTGRPRLLDQHYYFVNGCVSAPIDCHKANGDTWGEYYTELRRLYDESVASLSDASSQPSFDEWARQHVHFLSAQTAADGVYEIKKALPENSSPSDIHMIGTSAGGASIISYLGRVLRGEVPLDKRLRSAVAVDSPLGFQFPFRSSDIFLGIQAGAMKSDVELGMGEWAKAANISLFTVNTPNDIVNHETIPDVPDDAAPIYPQADAPPTPIPGDIGQALSEGSTWHIYTGSHIADSTRQFMEGHWR